MRDLLDTIRQTIDNDGLPKPPSRLIVAVSGGADSIALLAALTRLGYECSAAHCNFHLRGEESNRDMRHVEQICERLGTNLYIKDFDVYAQCRDSGQSIEMACRELRYAWFDKLLDLDRAEGIAVGHHMEDRVETFFLNLLRGSGLNGLSAMRTRSGNVIRPMLGCSRDDIERFLTENGLQWVDDSSNASELFSRNKLRNSVIPTISDKFSGATDAILRTMAILDEQRQFFDRAITAAMDKYRISGTDDINLKALQNESPDARLILYETLRHEGYSRRQTDDMLRAAVRDGGLFNAGHTHCREVDHGILRAPRAPRTDTPEACEISLRNDILYPVEITVSTHSYAEGFTPRRDPQTAYFDKDVLNGDHKWELRHWRRGDRIIPFGMSKPMLVSDIFAKAKLSAAEKQSAWLLCRDNDILWIAGLRASALFAVTPHTDKYIMLTLKKPLTK